MPRGTPWREQEVERLFEMRDVKHMKWLDIARSLGRCGPGRDGPAACCAAYKFWKEKFAREAELRARGIEPPPRYSRRRAPIAPTAGCEPGIMASPKQAADLNAVVKRPRYFDDTDALIRQRIARQGLTAGVFGDPPPGRSALDRRQP